MSKSILKSNRFGIVVNYFSLFMMLFFFEWIVKFDQKENLILLVGLAVGLVLFLSSFCKVYWKSKWWKYIHQTEQSYDERERESISNALRKAYASFAVIILMVLLIFAVFAWEMDNVFVVVFLFLAHILPASILKWQGYKI